MGLLTKTAGFIQAAHAVGGRDRGTKMAPSRSWVHWPLPFFAPLDRYHKGLDDLRRLRVDIAV